MRGLLVACVVLAAPASAAAWCQSANFQPPRSDTCLERCITEADIPPGERLLYLAWSRPCLSWVLNARGSRDLASDEVRAVFERSFATWTSTTCPGGRTVPFDVRFDPRVGRCRTEEHLVGEGNANQMFFVDDWIERDYEPRILALTTAWYGTRSGEIFDADMALNEQQWEWATCPEDGCLDGRIDLENTVTHELGHFFGIAHTPASEDATMWACASDGETHKRLLEADDVDAFCTIYGPDALNTECDHEPRGGFDARCESDRGCGCAAPGASSSDVAGWACFAVLVGVWHCRRR